MSAVALPPKFINLMVEARDKKETGKLYAYYRDEAMIHIGMLFFNKGRLCGCKYDKLSGLDAFKKLFRSAIATAMFVRTQKGEIEEQSSMPDVTTVISNLTHESNADAAPWNLSGDELLQAVSKTLGDILGEKGQKNVISIASKYPPERNAAMFTNECINMAANFLGMKRARELIEPLLE